MKKALIFAVILFTVFASLVQARVWTDSKGRKVTADYAGMSETDSSKVKLKMENGSIFSVSISSLSKEDQAYIKSLNKGAGAPSNGFGSDDDESVSEDNSNPNNVVVVVEGAGETLAEAKKDALRCAVEEVVGSLVDAQTRVENDELIEQVLIASSAYVEKYSVISRKIENGVATVKIRATVVKSSLTKKLKLAGGGQTFAVDGANLVDMASSKVDSEKSGATFLANFLKKEEFPYSLLDTKVIDKPKITQKGKEVVYTLVVEASINRERYMDFVKRVKPIFDKYAIQKSSFVLDTYIEDNHITYSRSNVPGERYEGPHLPFYLCTGVTGNFRSLRFETYELPNKFSIPLGYYKRVAPVVEVSLLNGDNEIVATKRAMLGFIEDEYEPFNAMPSMFDVSELVESDVIGESTVLPFRYDDDYFETGWGVFAPYRYYFDGGSNIIHSQYFAVSIVLSPEELSKVKTAKIAVIVNNPEMDKAFKRMEREIEQIPTE